MSILDDTSLSIFDAGARLVVPPKHHRNLFCDHSFEASTNQICLEASHTWEIGGNNATWQVIGFQVDV